MSSHARIICLVIMLQLTGRASAADIHVPDDWATIQLAITAAFPNDTIIVAPGTYEEDLNTDGKDLIIRSSGGPYVTSLAGYDTLPPFTNLSVFSGTVVLDGFTITNAASQVGVAGGTVATSAELTVVNCIFRDLGNTAVNLQNGDFLFANCVFASNVTSGDAILATSTGSAGTLLHCTFADNAVDDPNGAAARLGDDIQAFNCIFFDNLADGSPSSISTLDGENPAVQYSIVEGGFAGTGNIDADPQFVDAAGFDFRLDRCSPGIDAGWDVLDILVFGKDLDGNPRYDDPGKCDTGVFDAPLPDMGAYERQTSSKMTWTVSAGESIQDAIDNACDLDTIIVEAGTYEETLDLNGKIVRLVGEDGPLATIIDGSSIGGTVLDATTPTCEGERIIEGFTFTGGTSSGLAVGGGSTIVRHCRFVGNSGINGGGVRVSGGQVIFGNCEIIDNVTIDTLVLGAGAYVTGSEALFLNCVFARNIGEGNAVFAVGGGLAADMSDVHLVNCTVTNNFVTGALLATGGGVSSTDGTMKLVSTIVWGNTADDGTQLSGDVTAKYSCIDSGWPGSGNITSNPMFVAAASDDYRLSAGSPAIDSGQPSAIPWDVADLDGDGVKFERTPIDLGGLPRLANDPATEDSGCRCAFTGIVDMGAHEFPGDEVELVPDADFDASGSVDTTDFLELLSNWGAECGDEDFDCNTDVDTVDFLYLLSQWG